MVIIKKYRLLQNLYYPVKKWPYYPPWYLNIEAFWSARSLGYYFFRLTMEVYGQQQVKFPSDKCVYGRCDQCDLYR